MDLEKGSFVDIVRSANDPFPGEARGTVSPREGPTHRTGLSELNGNRRVGQTGRVTKQQKRGRPAPWGWERAADARTVKSPGATERSRSGDSNSLSSALGPTDRRAPG